MIKNLPEVTEDYRYITAHSKGAFHLISVLDSDPKTDGCYLITIYERDNSHRAHLHSFKVNAKNYAINYYNIMPEITMPYKTWSDSLKRANAKHRQ